MNLEFEAIILLSGVVAFVALIPLFFVKEKRAEARKITLKIGLKELPHSLRTFIVIAALFALGNFTYMLFLLNAEQIFIERMAFDKMTALAMALLLYI